MSLSESIRQLRLTLQHALEQLASLEAFINLDLPSEPETSDSDYASSSESERFIDLPSPPKLTRGLTIYPPIDCSSNRESPISDTTVIRVPGKYIKQNNEI